MAAGRPVQSARAFVLARKTTSNDAHFDELALSTGHSQIESKVSFHSHASDDALLAADTRGDGPTGRGRAGRWPRRPRAYGEMVLFVADARGMGNVGRGRVGREPALPSADAQEYGPVAADVRGRGGMAPPAAGVVQVLGFRFYGFRKEVFQASAAPN